VNNKIELKITTPRGLKFEEEADMVIMRCIDGDLGVLPGHEPISAVLGDGILRIYNNDYVKKLAVFGGIADIDQKSIKIFTTIAQRPDEIDVERAESDLREAEATMIEELEENQVRRLQVLMRRALVRIEVSSHPEETIHYDNQDS